MTCPVSADRVGSVTLRLVAILPSSRPPASSPQLDSPMITGTTIKPQIKHESFSVGKDGLILCLLHFFPQKCLPVGYSDFT